MASLNGYIKIHRKLLDWEWYADPVVRSVFLHLLLTVNFREKEWQGKTIRKGQVVTSYAKLSSELGFSVQQIRTAMKKLNSTGELTSEPTSKYTVVTIENWGKYQDCGEEATSESTSNPTIEQQTINKQSTSNQQQLKKDKNNKKDKKDKKYISADAPEDFFPLDGKLDRTFRDFIRHREQIKQPMTENAVRLMIGKLEKMTTDNNEKVQILEESIMNGWKGIFPLKDGQKKQDGNVFLKLAREFAEEEGDGWFEGF